MLLLSPLRPPLRYLPCFLRSFRTDFFRGLSPLGVFAMFSYLFSVPTLFYSFRRIQFHSLVGSMRNQLLKPHVGSVAFRTVTWVPVTYCEMVVKLLTSVPYLLVVLGFYCYSQTNSFAVWAPFIADFVNHFCYILASHHIPDCYGHIRFRHVASIVFQWWR